MNGNRHKLGQRVDLFFIQLLLSFVFVCDSGAKSNFLPLEMLLNQLSRFGVFPQQITLAAPWLDKLEGRLDTLSGKPVELIFGLNDDLLGSPEVIEKWRGQFPKAPVQLDPGAGHFTQEDTTESFVFSLRRILKQIETSQ